MCEDGPRPRWCARRGKGQGSLRSTHLVLERALAEQDDPKTWYRLGRARREAKDLAGAADAFERCGDDARAKFWAACCRGDPSEDAPIEHLEALYDGYAQLRRAPLGRAPKPGAGARRGRLRRESTEGLGLWLRHGPLGPRVIRCGGLFKTGRRRPLGGDVRQGARHGALRGMYPRASSVRIAASVSLMKHPDDRNVRRAD